MSSESKNNVLEVKVSELQKRSLFVATPMYGGQCHGTFAKSCIDLQLLCDKYGINIKFYYIFNESLITRARNYCVDEFLRSGYSHLMFIDSDIGFNANDVISLLAIDKEISSGPYPKKTIAWEKIYQACHTENKELKKEIEDDPSTLNKYIGDYVFNPESGSNKIRIDTPTKVMEAGTGFMMIKKEVFEKLKKDYPELEYKPDHNRTKYFDGSRTIFCFFDTVIDEDSRRYLSEDYFFCKIAKKSGIDIWLCPWMKLTHTGAFVFSGSLSDMAKIGASHGYTKDRKVENKTKGKSK